jgi:hypothetical protein
MVVMDDGFIFFYTIDYEYFTKRVPKMGIWGGYAAPYPHFRASF